METDCKYLFVYGSLLINDNGFGIYLKSHSRYHCKGSFNGKLYDMGEYPGAIYLPYNEGKVYGDIVVLQNVPKVLKVLDQYEGFGDDEVQPNLFIRKIIPVDTTMGIVNCRVYLCNISVDNFPRILSGRYK